MSELKSARDAQCTPELIERMKTKCQPHYSPYGHLVIDRWELQALLNEIERLGSLLGCNHRWAVDDEHPSHRCCQTCGLVRRIGE